MSEQKEIKVTW